MPKTMAKCVNRTKRIMRTMCFLILAVESELLKIMPNSCKRMRTAGMTPKT